jgi:hypothetical protein
VPDIVEKVGFEVVAARRIGGRGLGRYDWRRHRKQLGELAEVLGGGGEVEFMTGAVRPAQSQPIEH